MKKRLLSLALALMMALALLPATAFAADAEPLTVNKVTLSEVVVTDEYDSFPADFDFPESYYNLGRIGFLTDDNKYEGFQTFGCYIVPDDAVFSFEVGEDETVTVWFFALEDVTEEGASAKVFGATELGSITSEESATLTKAEMEDFQETFDLVICRVGDDSNNDVFVMFAGKDAAEPEAPGAEPETPAFTDVPDGAWYAEPVAWAVENGLTTGTVPGKFEPEIDCTHAQILTFLYRAERGSGTASGADMVAAFGWAKQKGMIDDSFEADAKCTRAQAVNYIWQAKGKIEAKEASSFEDVDADADYAAAVSWAVEKGVTKGNNADGTLFEPDTVCSRGHIVTFLYRAYND